MGATTPSGGRTCFRSPHFRQRIVSVTCAVGSSDFNGSMPLNLSVIASLPHLLQMTLGTGIQPR
jgi:hypothetical protein